MDEAPQQPAGPRVPDLGTRLAVQAQPRPQPGQRGGADLGEVLAVPEEAVFDTGTQRIVFVDKGQGLFEPREVTVGANADGDYELKAGVAEGEQVVTSGNFLIDSESRLRAAIEGMVEGAPQHGQCPPLS